MQESGGEFYNRYAGKSVERLGALSDGLFAVAMTLLVLDLHVPASDLVRGERDLFRALVPLLPRLITYLMSFLTLGIFWVGQQMQLNFLTRSNRDATWLHLIFLFGVSLLPFSTALLATYVTYRTALLLYWLNIFFLGLMLFIGWQYAWRAGLVKDGVPGVHRATMRRIVIAQALYACGALLCVINTYVSIAFIVLVQLNYVIAPRIRPLYRI